MAPVGTKTEERVTHFLDAIPGDNARTRSSQGSIVHAFQAWCKSQGQTEDQHALNAWRKSAAVRRLAASSRERYVGVVKAYLRFHGESVAHVRAERVPLQILPRTPWAIVEGALALAKAADVRDWCVLSTAALTGAHPVGVANLKWSGVHEATGELETLEKGHQGGPKLRTRNSPLGPLRITRSDGIAAWRAWRTACEWSNEPTSCFQMRPRSIADLIHEYLSKAGAAPEVANARALRRAYARWIVDLSGDVEAARAGLGHTDYDWTLYYTGLTVQEQGGLWATLRERADRAATAGGSR